MTKFFIILITTLALALPAAADLLFYESYENYSMGSKNFFSYTNPDFWRPNKGSNDKYYEIVGSPTRSGNKAMKFYNRRVAGTSSYRMEHTLQKGPGLGTYNFKIGKEYWIGFSIYLPADFVCDGCNSSAYSHEIHMQLKGIPDSGESKSLNPPIALQIIADKWIVKLRSDSHKYTDKTNYDRQVKYDVGSWLSDKGKWTDWVFHLKLDYTKNGDNGGFLKVYKNGALVVNDTGGNCYNDLSGPYFAIGTYKYGWIDGPTDTDTRIVYFDEFRVGDKDSNLYSISPASTILDAPSDLEIVPLQ